MRATGKMIRLTDSVFTFTSMAPAMRVSGEMIFRMAGVLNPGLMGANTMAATRRA